MPTYAFLGGGTGGHLFPAIALAEHLKRLDPTARAVVLCSEKPLDAEILTKAIGDGHIDAFEPVPARPLAASPRGLIKLVTGWLPSVKAARKALEKHPPSAAIAMGGYVAVPGASAARSMKIPLALINLDAVPGKANRYIASRAKLRIAAMHNPNLPGDWVTTGPIVRAHSVRPMDPADARSQLGLDPTKRTLLICGASQGARSVNDFITAFVRANTDTLTHHNWQILHQTGAADFERITSAYDDHAPAITLPFIEDMAPAWAAADLAIARAGAGLVAEVVATRTNTIFMPYPFHKDQHQKLNAAPAVAAGLARIWEDLVKQESNIRAHSEALRDLLTATTLNLGRGPDNHPENTPPAEIPPANGAEQAAGAIRDFIDGRAI